MRLPLKEIHFLNYLTYTGVNGTISQLYNYNLFFNFRPKYPWFQHFDLIGVRISEITTCSKYNKNEICFIETAVHDPRSDWRKKSSTISWDCPFRAGKWNKAIILFVLPHTLSTQNNTQSKLSVGLKKLEICGGINDERNS